MRAKYSVLIFLAGTFIYALMNYGGVRAPDSEIVFRVSESLESDHGFSVARDLENWRGFGVATGRDGKLYSVFGPGQSILGAPLIKLAKGTECTGRLASHKGYFPLSFYLPDGLALFAAHSLPRNLKPHALRCVVSYLYIPVSAAALVLFWLIMQKMVPDLRVSLSVTVLYGFGTLAFPYSSMFLSEPLATLFVLASFYCLIGYDPHFQPATGSLSGLRLLLAGFFLGAATTAHITAILFFPFFFLYCAHFCHLWSREWKNAVWPVVLFVFGFSLLCLWLAHYNYSRFGNILETGRTADILEGFQFGYGRFVPPWLGLYGLTVNPGKGIVWFCPAVMLGIVCWRCLHRSYPALSYVLASAAIFRLIFIATRSDWHGGFCLGPRFLLMLVPFLLLPIGYWLQEQLHRKSRIMPGLFALFTFACISQQLFFSIGEMCSYYYILKWKLNSFDIGPLYLTWSTSPLFRLLQFRRGPFALHGIGLSNVSLWMVASALTAVVLGVGYYFLFASRQNQA